MLHLKLSVSALLTLAVLISPVTPLWALGTTTRISVTPTGKPGGNYSTSPDLTPDGRYVAFASYATNLVQGDSNRVCDIFVHDRTTRTTSLASVSTAGAQGNGHSYAPSVSADGRYVAFYSWASNLVPGDTNRCPDAFVRDCVTGQTERVSVSNSGEQANAGSGGAVISADGRYVAFHSLASNLVSGDVNGYCDVFARDRTTGVTKLVSLRNSGQQNASESCNPSISADGRYVAFSLKLGLSTSPFGESVLVRDVVRERTLTVGFANTDYSPSISADGRLVAFTYNGMWDDGPYRADQVYLWDMASGQTKLVSATEDGMPGSGPSQAPRISADGRHIAYQSLAGLITSNTDDWLPRTLVRDLITNRTTVVSFSPTGEIVIPGFEAPSVSRDGRYVAFGSRWLYDLWDNSCSQPTEVYLRDRGYDGDPPTPEVVAVSPRGQDCSAQSPVVQVTFSETMDRASAEGAFSITPRAAGRFSWSGKQMRYTVAAALKPSTIYTATVTTAARSAAGPSIAASRTWSFETNGHPAIGRVSPTGATVWRSSVITIAFNGAMKRAVTQRALSISPPTVGAFAWAGHEMRFTPANDLAANTTYRVNLAATATAMDGLQLETPYAWTFSTSADPALATLRAASARTAAGTQFYVLLGATAGVTARIRNLAGRTVAVLPSATLASGSHSLLWNERSTAGTRVPPGAYVAEVTALTDEGAVYSAIVPLRL